MKCLVFLQTRGVQGPGATVLPAARDESRTASARSMISARSNLAREAKMPASILPVGAARSMPSRTDQNSMPSATIQSSRRAMSVSERPRRSRCSSSGRCVRLS